LTASGTPGTYLWSNGATTQSINVSPGSTTTYSVTVTTAEGCSASASGTVDLAPPGAGFQIVMPGMPTETTAKTPDGTSDIHIYKFTDPARGIFTVSYYDYPLAIKAGETGPVLDSERDRLVASLPGSKVINDRPTTIAGQEGREVMVELSNAKGASVGQSSRIVLVNSRIMTASFGGQKDALTSKPAIDFLDSFRPTIRGGTASGNAGAGASASAEGDATPKSDAAKAPAAASKKTQKSPSPASRPKTNTGGGTPF